MFHCSLTGTLFVYQGEEIGLCNVPRDWPEEEYKDIETKQGIEGERRHRWIQGGQKGKMEDVDVRDVLQAMRWTARDNGRTPMQVSYFNKASNAKTQWDSSEHAGFSQGTPWMRVHDDYKEGWNVQAQVANPNSVWSFWRKMLAIRKQYEALIYGQLTASRQREGLPDFLGTFVPLDVKNEKTYAYIRDDSQTSQRLLIILNLARSPPDEGDFRHGERAIFSISKEVDVSKAKLIITNGSAAEGSKIKGDIELDPWEGRIYQL